MAIKLGKAFLSGLPVMGMGKLAVPRCPSKAEAAGKKSVPVGKAVVPTPKVRKRIKERPRTAKKRRDTAWVRPYVFKRERDKCRFCGDLPAPNGARAAESRHELLFKSVGGKVNPENCVAACGSGTTGCHGLAQQYELKVEPLDRDKGAEGPLHVTVATQKAAAWLGLAVGTTYTSRPRFAAYRPL